MAIARSKLTSQGQISVPLAVRKRLGLSPGGSIEWIEEEGKIVVRRAGRYTLDDIHKALFPDGPPPALSLEDHKEGIRRYMRKKYARP
jgi:antitoxin PrlF